MNINSCTVIHEYTARSDVNSSKIGFHNAKVDFPLILFDLHACYSELSFERKPEILIQKKT